MSDYTEAQIAAIVKDVMHRELIDPDSMFRMVLERAFSTWGKQLKTEIQAVIEPVSVKAEAALDLQQQQNSTKRLKDNAQYWVEMAVKIFVLGGFFYGLYSFLKH